MKKWEHNIINRMTVHGSQHQVKQVGVFMLNCTEKSSYKKHLSFPYNKQNPFTKAWVAKWLHKLKNHFYQKQKNRTLQESSLAGKQAQRSLFFLFGSHALHKLCTSVTPNWASEAAPGGSVPHVPPGHFGQHSWVHAPASTHWHRPQSTVMTTLWYFTSFKQNF